MVTEVPSNDEVLGLQEEDENTPLLEDEDMSLDEQLMYVAIFAILTQLYTDFEHKSADYILNKFPDAAAKAEKKIHEISKTELDKIISEHKIYILQDFGIHPLIGPQVRLDLNLKGTYDILSSSIKATINQLKDDIKTKSLAVKEKMADPEDFNLKANFRRASRRVKNFVKFNVQFAKQKVTRAAQKMRYGKNMLYYWVVARINTCEKCYARERLPPRKIDEWPYDHPNGRCKLVPVDDHSTVEYLKHLEESNMITMI